MAAAGCSSSRPATTNGSRSSLRIFDARSGTQLELPALSGSSVHLWASVALSPDSRWVLGLGVTRMGAWEVMVIEVPQLAAGVDGEGTEATEALCTL